VKIGLMVHDAAPLVGQGRYTGILADELSTAHDVTIFANTCERPPSARWTFHPVRACRITALTSVYTFPYGLRSLRAVTSECDIRHAQGYCGGHPNVVTAHICVAAYLASLRAPSWRTRCSLRLMALAERRFYRRYLGPVIAVSRKVATELADFYGIARRIDVVHHGVDTARFTSKNRERDRAGIRAALGLDTKKTTALYVGDLTKAYTHLRAVADSTPDVQFVIITPSTRYRWRAANIRFVAPTPHVERYYAAADAFLFPTTYDAFGMVVLEAMASGLAVCVSDRAGVAELIHDGLDGFVIPLEKWREAISTVLGDTDALYAVGAAAEQTAKRHDWETVVRAVERVYGDVAHD